MRSQAVLSMSIVSLALLSACNDEPLSNGVSPWIGQWSEPANVEPTNILEPSSQDLWSSVMGSMAVKRMVHTSTALTDGRVLVTGGLFGFGALSNTAEIFDPATNMFSAAGTLPNLSNGQTSGRWSHAAVRDMQGNVVVTGGELPGNVYLSSSVKCTYDSVAKSCTWTVLADMKYPRRAHVFVRLADGRLLAAGGNALGDPGVSASAGARVCEIYDPATNTWTETEKLAVGRADAKGALLPDGRVLVIGGIDGLTLRNTAEIWNPATGTWTLLASTMSVPRYTFQAVTLSSGKVLAIGGGIDTNATPTKSVDVFDPVTATFTAVAPMNIARAYHVAELIPGGRVLAAGGDNLASSEVYDPVTNQWTNNGAMGTQRANAAVSALGNGGVLVSGGGIGLNPVSTADVFRLDFAVGTSCTLATECASGFCADGVCCNAACNAGACDSCSTGTCEMLTGPVCNDGNACTQMDSCNAGTCAGANPVSCSALDECHEVGMCNSQTGICSNPPAPDGTACEGGSCQKGICQLDSSSSSSSSSGGGMGGAGGGSGGNGGTAGASSTSSTSSSSGGDAGAGGKGGPGGAGGAAGGGGDGESGGSGGGQVGDDSGCGCVVVGDARGPGSAIGIVMALAALGRRRRR